MRSFHTLDRLDVTFDDDNAVAGAGLLLAASLTQRLDLVGATNRVFTRGFRPGRKFATLVHGLVAGGDCIDDVDVLRAGSSEQVLAHKVMAPSTIGSWLRDFTFGHVRQLDRVAELMLTRAWQLGAAPSGEMTFDMDSTVQQVFGYQKQGAGYGYTRQLGLHPLLATRADTGEQLHIRMRKGSAGSGRGADRFTRETVGRVRRAADAAGVGHLQLKMRADSAFWSKKVIAACKHHDVRFSITVRRTSKTVAAIDSIPDDAWTQIEYPEGIAQVAEARHGKHRLIVRRVSDRNFDHQLFPTWRYHAFVTDIADASAVELDAWHRKHAVVELGIRDLKEGAGLKHMPSGVFAANAAWAVACTLAHNLLRWTAKLGLQIDGLVVAKTIRRKLLTIPGRIVRSGRRQTLRMPTNWPWADDFTRALTNIRSLPKPA